MGDGDFNADVSWGNLSLSADESDERPTLVSLRPVQSFYASGLADPKSSMMSAANTKT